MYIYVCILRLFIKYYHTRNIGSYTNMKNFYENWKFRYLIKKTENDEKRNQIIMVHKYPDILSLTNRRNAISRKCVYPWVRALYENS